MRLKKTFLNIAILSIGLNAAAFAFDYFPPERITCELNAMGNLSCEQINRHYLVEDTTNADLQGKNEVFYFASAATDKKDPIVHFAYSNMYNKTINLKTTNSSIHPNLASKHWRKMEDGSYICDSGYMHCVITDAPN